MSRRAREHPYRGDDPGERIARLEEEIARQRARITEAYWTHLGELATRAYAAPLDVDPREHELALAALRDELADAIARAPEMTAWLSALPNSAGDELLGEPWRSAPVMPAAEWSASRSASLERRIARWVDGYDGNATLLQLEKGGPLRATFRALDAPMALEAAVYIGDLHGVTLATAVARGVPGLEVEPKAWTHALASAMGMRKNALTGDEAFDRRFAIAAESHAATRVLGTEARTILASLDHLEALRLSVGNARARVHWRAEIDTTLLDASVQLLSVIRHARVRLELVRS
jgi:hypothetical protein